MHSPNWLFFYPGITLSIIGLILGTIVVTTQFNLLGVMLDINTLLYSAAMVIVGFNLISFHVFTKTYAVQARFIKVEKSNISKLNANNCAVCGLIAAIIGVGMTVYAFVLWGREAFGDLNPEKFMRLTIPAVTLIVVGIQLLFSGFFIDILRIRVKE